MVFPLFSLKRSLTSMRQPAPFSDVGPTLKLGLEGFSFEDLYAPQGLQRLTARFYQTLEKDDKALFEAFCAHRDGQTRLSGPAESELLIRLSEHLSAFLVTLFGLQEEAKGLSETLTRELSLFEFKREFITRRVFKKGAPDRPTEKEFPELDARVKLLFELGFQDHRLPIERKAEA